MKSKPCFSWSVRPVASCCFDYTPAVSSDAHRQTDTFAFKKFSQHGFTLIELLTVIAIIAILAAILIPVVSSVRNSARTAQATSNVREIGTLTHLYMDENNGRLPTDLFGNANAKPWIEDLWEIAYPGREFPEFNASVHGNELRDTVFYTPLLEEEAANGGIARSFGWSVSLRVNSRGSVAQGMYHGHISGVRNPSLTVALSDSMSSSNIRAGSPQINFRNNGRALFLFLDGHVESLRPDQVPENENHVFWGGTSGDESGPTPRR